MMQRRNQAINIAFLNVNTLDTSACDDYQMYLKEDLEVGLKVTKMEKFELKKELSNWDDNVTETFGDANSIRIIVNYSLCWHWPP